MMRPDEQANQAQIDRDKRIRQNVGRGVKTAAEIGLTVASAYAIPAASARVLPWLNKYIPPELAMKGLKKVAPKVAGFLERGLSMGLDLEEGMNFVKDKISTKNEKESPENAENPHKTGKNAKESRNIIEQYSPELHQFIDQEVKKGRPVIQAGALAQNDKRFTDIIKKLSKDHKTDWSSILESVYGGAQSPNASQQQQSPQQGQQMQPAQAQGGQQQKMQDPLRQALMMGDIGEIKRVANVNDKQAQEMLRRFIQNSPQEANQQDQGDKWGQIGQTLKDILNS
jgi:hypothetical protein